MTHGRLAVLIVLDGRRLAAAAAIVAFRNAVAPKLKGERFLDSA